MNQCLALKPSAANGLLLSKPPPGRMSFFHFTPMPNHRRQGYIDSGRLAHANRRATRLIRALAVMSSVGACLVPHHLKHQTAAVGGIFPSPSSIARGVALRPVCRIAVVSRTCRWSAALHLPARVCPAAAKERSLRPTRAGRPKEPSGPSNPHERPFPNGPNPHLLRPASWSRAVTGRRPTPAHLTAILVVW